MAVVMTVQFFMGLSIVSLPLSLSFSPVLNHHLNFTISPPLQVLAASRQSWAFSRDGALPFSSFFRKVSQHRLTRYQPVRMVCGVIGASAIIGLLSLIDNAAANALFSLAVAGNDLAWLTPILARLLWGQDKFVPGEFYTGRYLSKPIAWIAVIYMLFAPALCCVVRWMYADWIEAENMNYTVVINGALWLGALLYYYVHARKTFKGPQTTVSPEDEGKQMEAEAETVAGDSEKS